MNINRRPRVSRGEGFALGLIATGAISVAAAALTSIIQTAFALFGSEVTVRMPVIGGEVRALAGVSEIASAEYASADVALTTLPAPARWLLLFEGALPAVATIGVCLMAWWLGIALMRARPFSRAMSWAIGTAAILVIVGGMLGQLLGAIGRAEVVRYLAASDSSVTKTFWLFLAEFDLAPLGWGFALALIAGAFEIGQRMQRDTAGLV